MRYLRCPECNKKGVSLRLRSHGEDLYGCKYCEWYCYVEGNDMTDVRERQRLIDANPFAGVLL